MSGEPNPPTPFPGREGGDTKTRALEGLNEAVRRCMLAGVELGAMQMWNSRGRWCLCFEVGVVWDEGNGFTWGCEEEEG